MSETKWTPGPWIQEDRDILSVALIDAENPKRGREVIAAAHIEANAHLIAAAPELYEALAEMVAGWEGFDVNDDAANRVRALLAKARGE